MKPESRAANGLIAALWVALLLLAFAVYEPGLKGPALLDDGVNLQPLSLLEDNPDLASDVVFGNLSGPLGRPLSMLSFTLEKLYFDAGFEGHKTSNLFLHLFTATLFFLFARDLFRHMDFPVASRMALFAAAFWLFAPLLLSTVLYTIQRMAQFVALFVLLAQWAYLRARLSQGAASRICWALICVLALIAAPLSKENGVIALPMLVLLEWLVLRCKGLPSDVQQHFTIWVSRGVFVALVGFIILCVWQPAAIFGGYAYREFTLIERLFTELRIVWIYLAQLLWVVPDRLGIYHDSVAVSRSLMVPTTTGVAAVAFVGLLTLCWLQRWRWPLLVYGVIFFLLAHVVESTVLPLELYFEHRNYLSAMGLCIAVVAVGVALWRRRPWLGNWLVLLYLLVVGRSVAVLATESQIWSNNMLFHLNAINRFPDSPRANLEFARLLASMGELDTALQYADRAYPLQGQSQSQNQRGLIEQLIDLNLRCQASDAISTDVLARIAAVPADFYDRRVSDMMYLLVKRLIADSCPGTDIETLADRLQGLSVLVPNTDIYPKMFVSLAILENHIGRYAQALAYIDRLLMRSPESIRGMMMKLYFTAQLGMDEPHREVLHQLQGLELQGLLNQQQSYNLALFSGDESATEPWGLL